MRRPHNPDDLVQLDIRSLHHISRVSGYPLVNSTATLDKVPALLEAVSVNQPGEEDPEFCLAVTFDPYLISGAVYRGIFPMTVTVWEVPIMALKLHTARCLVRPSDMVTSRSVRRRARRYVCTINQRRADVLTFIRNRHEDCWLSPQLWRSFCAIDAAPADHNGMRLFSFEVWEADTGRLAAAELGYTLGGIYTSLTGAFDRRFPGAGSVQLAVTGALLKQRGFACWDLGMAMDYKIAMGGQQMPRQQWQEQVARLRSASTAMPLELKAPLSCREIIDEAPVARSH